MFVRPDERMKPFLKAFNNHRRRVHSDSGNFFFREWVSSSRSSSRSSGTGVRKPRVCGKKSRARKKMRLGRWRRLALALESERSRRELYY